MIKKLIVLLLALKISSIAFTQDIKIGPPQSWVEQVNSPETSQISKYDIISGVYFSLIDYQTHLEEDIRFNHFIQNIVTSGGVSNASQLQITYDSSYQEVIFHYLRVKRKGVNIDKADQIKFEFIKNEDQIQSNIYTGYVTALLVIEDLRKDDQLEYAYSIKGSNPIFKQGRFYSFVLEDVNPIDQIRIRITYDDNGKNQYKCIDCDDIIGEESIDGRKNILIDRSNVKAFKTEETMPSWIIPYKYIMVSNTNSWSEINDWALDIFTQNDDEKIDQIFSEIFYPEYTLDDKINAIIDFVQDDIRYMGIESGIGSILPFTPNQVITQRFGDCKDKSLLMSTMLRKIGIENSYPVLVNSEMNDNIDNFIPSGYVFDHCITYFEIDDQKFWIDPTNSYQGGTYKTMITYDFGKGLIVRPGNAQLTELQLDDTTSITRVDEFLDATSFYRPAELIVKTDLYGNKADRIRQILEYYSKKQLAEFYKYSYGRIFPSLLENEKLNVIDNIEKNEMKILENYSIPNFWNQSDPDFPNKHVLTYEPTIIYSYISAVSCEKKEFPVVIGFPNKVVQVTTIELPGPMKSEPEVREFDNKAFYFKQTTNIKSQNKLIIKYEYSSKTNEIAPEDFQQVCKDINEIVNNLGSTVYYPIDMKD